MPNYSPEEIKDARQLLGLPAGIIDQTQLDQAHAKLAARLASANTNTEKTSSQITKLNHAKTIIQHGIDKKNNFDQFIFKLSSMKENKKGKKRTRYLKENIALITNGTELHRALNCLAVRDEINDLASQCKDRITSIDELNQILPHLSKKKRVKYLSKSHLALLDRSGDKLSATIKLLAKKHQASFAMDMIERQPANLSLFTTCIYFVDIKDRLAIASNILASHKTGNDLLTTAACLAKPQQPVFMSRVNWENITIADTGELIALLQTLPNDKQLPFIMQKGDVIKNHDELIRALKTLAAMHPNDADQYLTPLSLKISGKISDWAHFVELLKLIKDNANHATLFSSHQQHLVNNTEQITEALSLLSLNEREAAYLSVLDRIETSEIANSIALLPADSRFAHATDYLNSHEVKPATLNALADSMPSEERKGELLELFLRDKVIEVIPAMVEVPVKVMKPSFFQREARQPFINHSPKSELNTAVKTGVVARLNEYLQSHLKLHEKRVMELLDAVHHAESDDKISELVTTQQTLLAQGGNAERGQDYRFLDNAPGKASLSLGYKKMLADCRETINGVSPTRSCF